MSLANFEDFYEICCGITEDELIVKLMKQLEEGVHMEDHLEQEEIKKERELFYV